MEGERERGEREGERERGRGREREGEGEGGERRLSVSEIRIFSGFKFPFGSKLLIQNGDLFSAHLSPDTSYHLSCHFTPLILSLSLSL